MLLLKAKDVTEQRLEELLFDKPVDEFEIKCVNDWHLVIDGETTYIPTMLEKIIEDNEHSCRIYLQARRGFLMSISVPVVGQMLGAATAIGMAAHNLATYNPDFEIRKGMSNKVRVTNKKKIKRDKIEKEQSR